MIPEQARGGDPISGGREEATIFGESRARSKRAGGKGVIMDRLTPDEPSGDLRARSRDHGSSANVENGSVNLSRMMRDDAPMTRILLARHAETAAPDRFHGAESDIGLSDRGREQAEQLGRRLAELKPSALYCSAMRRAMDTASPIGRACGLEPVVIPTIHERRIGPLSGASREDGWATYADSKMRWIAGELEATHPGGESYADIRRRVVPVLLEIGANHPGGTVVVVAHGVVIRVLLTSLVSGFTPADFDRIAIDFASVNDLRFDGLTWTAESLNQVVAPSPARPVA